MATEAKVFTRITRTPGVVGGEPVIAGTRVSVRILVQYARIFEGDLERVQANYPHITRADVDEALRYYDTHREEIDRYITENEDDE